MIGAAGRTTKNVPSRPSPSWHKGPARSGLPSVTGRRGSACFPCRPGGVMAHHAADGRDITAPPCLPAGLFSDLQAGVEQDGWQPRESKGTIHPPLNKDTRGPVFVALSRRASLGAFAASNPHGLDPSFGGGQRKVGCHITRKNFKIAAVDAIFDVFAENLRAYFGFSLGGGLGAGLGIARFSYHCHSSPINLGLRLCPMIGSLTISDEALGAGRGTPSRTTSGAASRGTLHKVIRLR